VDNYKDGQTKEIKEIGNFTDGYAIQKFRNVDVNGNKVQIKREILDADFPISV
jgi:hypothetical protein